MVMDLHTAWVYHVNQVSNSKKRADGVFRGEITELGTS